MYLELCIKACYFCLILPKRQTGQKILVNIPQYEIQRKYV